MTSLNVENWPIERILPFADNVHVHTDEQIRSITQSILQFGFVNPILVDHKGECIAGHGRLQAMRMLDRKEVPVIVLGHLSEQQANAYRIADNRIPLLATWDETLYRKQLEEFMSSGFPMESMGWGAEALDEFLSIGKKGLTNPDEVPEPPQHPSVRPGELWKLGEHRLLIGDCTNPESVRALFGSAKCNLMVTDPPYGVDYDPRWRLETGINKPHQKRAEGRVTNDDRADWREAWALFDGDVAYVWHGGLHAATVAAGLEAADFTIRSQIIWAKTSLVIGRGNYHWQHEPCWYAVRTKGHWHGDRKQSTLWQIENMHRTQGNTDDGKTIHSAQKPVECMKRPMENNSAPGGYVYDPFVGSGTSIIAAEMTGRRCLAIDVEPTYAQVSIERWQNFSGEQAKLNGKTFSDVVQERSNEISHNGNAIRSENVVGPVEKRKVRAQGTARLSATRRSAVRKPSSVHAKRRPQRR